MSDVRGSAAPVVKIVQGGVFIRYKGVTYNEDAFKTMCPEVYEAFFSGKTVLKVDLREACHV